MSCCEIKESSKVWNNTNRAKIFIVSLTIKSTIISLDWIQVKKIKFIVFYSIVTSTKRRTTREMDPLCQNSGPSLNYFQVQIEVGAIKWSVLWPSAHPFLEFLFDLDFMSHHRSGIQVLHMLAGLGVAQNFFFNFYSHLIYSEYSRYLNYNL